MKISNLVYGALFMVLFSHSFLQAEQEPPVKIGYVNLDRIMLESRAIKNVVGAVQDDMKKEQDSMSEKMTRYKVLSEAYDQQKTILTREQLKTRRQELDELKIAIEDQKDKISRMIRRSERELVEPTIELVDRAIQAVGKKEGYDLILRNDAVLFVSDRCDVTTRVLQMMEEMQKEDKIKKSPDIPSPAPETSPSSSPTPAADKPAP